MAKRLYSLFERGKDGRFIRISPLAFDKKTAIRVFQSALLAPYLGEACDVRELRVVITKSVNE